MVRKILEEKPIPLGQVHELLKIREETGINYVQRVTAQHAEKLSREAAYSEKILQILQEEFDLPRILAVQIVNMNPKTTVDVKAVTGTKLSDDQIEQLLEQYLEYVAEVTIPTLTTEADEEEDAEDELEEGFDDL